MSAEWIPWNRFLGSLKGLQIRALCHPNFGQFSILRELTEEKYTISFYTIQIMYQKKISNKIYEMNINLLHGKNRSLYTIRYDLRIQYHVKYSTHKELHGVSWLVAGW